MEQPPPVSTRFAPRKRHRSSSSSDTSTSATPPRYSGCAIISVSAPLPKPVVTVRNNTTRSAQIRYRTHNSCSLCEGPHFTYQCRKPLPFSYRAAILLVKRNLCPKCVRKHHLSTCLNTELCANCGGNDHATVLCQKPKASSI